MTTPTDGHGLQARPSQGERVAFLGPAGSFSHEAVQACRPDARLCPADTISQAIAALRDGAADAAVTPIENSFEGAVTETVDALIRHEDLVITGELLLRVEQNLIGVTGADVGRIEVVVSHPQALAQARAWLDAHLPRAERRAAASTARAVAELVEPHPEIAAIGPRVAAQIYGRVNLAAGIQSGDDNLTRFVSLRLGPAPVPAPTGHDRTTLILTVPDRPGSLVRALAEFDALGINMTKIESRPLGVSGRPAQFRESVFHIDIDGHQEDPLVAQALARLALRAEAVRVVGSYPCGEMPEGCAGIG